MSETKIQTLSQSTKAGWFQVLVFGFREPTCEAGRRAPGATATGNRASASPPNSRIDICVFVTCVLCVHDFPNGTLSYPYPLSPIYLMLPLNIINMTKSFTLRPVFNATRGYVADMFWLVWLDDGFRYAWNKFTSVITYDVSSMPPLCLQVLVFKTTK